MPKIYANQFTVKVAPREKEGVFCIFNQDALCSAMNELKPSELKLWLYIGKNKDNYEFALS